MIVSWGQLTGFFIVALVMIVIPGPGVLFVVGRALSHGRRTAMATAAGHSIGNYIVAVLIAVGLGALLARSEEVFLAVKLAGSVYLVWLGVQAFRHRAALANAMTPSPLVRQPSAGSPSTEQPLADAGDTAPKEGWRALRDGVVVGITNPKTFILFGAILPQFVNRAAGQVPAQMLILASVVVSLGLVSDSAWALAASFVRSWFARSPRRYALVGGAGGLAMIAVGLSVALTGRRN